jgi:hypothetical protein
MSIILYISTHVFSSCHQQACLSLFLSLCNCQSKKEKRKKRGVVCLTGTSADWLLPMWRSILHCYAGVEKRSGTLYLGVQPPSIYYPGREPWIVLACCSLQVTWLSPPPPFPPPPSSVIHKSRESGMEMITNSIFRNCCCYCLITPLFTWKNRVSTNSRFCSEKIQNEK